MTEESSGFENVIKDMNNSQILMSKVKIVKCENPNCKTAFAKYEKCKSCYKMFCMNCLLSCENCNQICCNFCSSTHYEKYKDTQICPTCEQNYQN